MDYIQVTGNEIVDRLLMDKAFVARLKAASDEEEMIQVFSELGFSVSHNELESICRYICVNYSGLVNVLQSDTWGNNYDDGYYGQDWLEEFTNADWAMLYKHLPSPSRLTRSLGAILERNLNDSTDRKAMQALLDLAGIGDTNLFNNVLCTLLVMDDCCASLYPVENIDKLYEKAKRIKPLVHKAYHINYELFLNHQSSPERSSKPSGHYAGLCYRERNKE